MKSYITIIIFSLISISGFSQADAITSFFSDYQESEDFSSVFISQKMFGMFANVEDEDGNVDEEIKRILNSLKGLRILSTENNGVALFKESKAKLVNNSYEMLMNVREDDNDVEFLIKEGENGKIQELLLLVGGEKGFTMLSFVGDVSLSDLGSLASKMDIEGLEYLDQLEDK